MSRWRTAEIPAINGHGSARGVAGLYAALLEGRILSPDLLREATTAQCEGTDAVFGHENAWGLGFAIDGEDFGMAGLGGSYGGASPPGRYAFGFVTGTMGTDDRAVELENALRTASACQRSTDHASAVTRSFTTAAARRAEQRLSRRQAVSVGCRRGCHEPPLVT